MKTSENLVLTEHRPIAPLIPFRAGLTILVLAKGTAGARLTPANARRRKGRPAGASARSRWLLQSAIEEVARRDPSRCPLRRRGNYNWQSSGPGPADQHQPADRRRGRRRAGHDDRRHVHDPLSRVPSRSYGHKRGRAHPRVLSRVLRARWAGRACRARRCRLRRIQSGTARARRHGARPHRCGASLDMTA